MNNSQATTAPTISPARPSFGEAFRFWLKLGFISFGGPAGQIAIMHQELVERRKWISEARFLHALNYCMLLPGPEATQLAIYIGWLLHKTRGGIVAGILFVLPSAFMLWGLSYVYVTLDHLPAVAAGFYGLKPAVLAIVAAAVIRIGQRALKNQVMWLVAALAFVAIFYFKAPFPLIILSAGIIGLLGGKWWPGKFLVFSSGVSENNRAHSHTTSDHRDIGLPTPHPPSLGSYGGTSPNPLPVEGRGDHGSAASVAGPPSPSLSVIDDTAEAAEHTKPSMGRAVRVCAVCLALWWMPVFLAGAWQGRDSVLFHEGWFFSKAALVTFGGAYAVLPFVAQQAVNHYHWLEPGQMLDGLGLAETTPGPLIMVLQYVGFLGGWKFHGALTPLAAATLGAALTTWVTFVPCFLWIFLGAPHIEQLRDNVRLTAALSTITAAVVGVILNLAVWFGMQALWPGEGRVDWFAVVVCAVAFAGMMKWKWNMVAVVIGGGVAGLAWRVVFHL